MPALDDSVREAVARDYAALTGRPAPEIELHYYPYSGLSHSLREREGRLVFRFSDLLADEPPDLVRVTARILMARMLGRQAVRRDREAYRRRVSRPRFRERLRRIRRQRSRKVFDPPRGRVYDLQELFDALNRDFFGGRVSIELLGWSRRESRRILGHYDRAHEAIIINRRLDAPRVPDFVVRYVLFHEMLHALLGEECTGERRQVHHRRFREAEKEFPDYERATAFIRDNLAVGH